MEHELIQQALKAEGLDGWLFYDHHRRDPLAYRILGLPDTLNPTRRWFYFIPSAGEPRALAHRIEPYSLDGLPGTRRLYSRWSELTAELTTLLAGARVIAMQYSPNNAVPYVGMVDSGTVEFVRSLGPEVRTSANLVQLFEARWTAAQLQSHLEAGKRMDAARAAAFDFIRHRLQTNAPTNEWDVHQFLHGQFQSSGLITDHGPIVAVNANASNPHYEPSAGQHSPILHGDLVLIDMWAKLDEPGSVYYDITWTGYCGSTPPDAMANVFRIVTGARDRAIQTVLARAGSGDLHGYEVDDAARGHIEQHGFGEFFIHRTGHSIGTSVHGAGANMDNFETHDERRIIPRTCFSIEPGVYLPEFGIRSEVNMYVGEDAARVTGEIQHELVILA
jgi:Xaa-Pro aminopeptidase